MIDSLLIFGAIVIAIALISVAHIKDDALETHLYAVFGVLALMSVLFSFLGGLG